MDTQLNEPTNQTQLKAQTLLIQQIRNRCYKTLGTSVINCQLSPLSLWGSLVKGHISHKNLQDGSKGAYRNQKDKKNIKIKIILETIDY